MIQPPARRISRKPLNEPCPAAATAYGNGLAVKSDAEIIAHGLYALVLLSPEPGKNGVTREVVHPTFKGVRHFDPEFLGAMEDGRPWVRGEDVGPDLTSREPPAYI